MENFKIPLDDDSMEESPVPGRSRGRGIRGYTNQITQPNVGAPSQTRPIPTQPNQRCGRHIQLQNQFQREVREEEAQRARIEARSQANQDRLTTLFHGEQDEASTSARYRKSYRFQTDVQFQSSNVPGASFSRDEMDERKQTQDKAEKEKHSGRWNFQRPAEASNSAQAMTTNEGTTQERQVSTRPMSARDVQLQNQFRQECREEERERARLEARREAELQRLNAQFQREQFLQEMWERNRNAQAAEHRAAQQERLNAQFHREQAEARAEEQRNAARLQKQQAERYPRMSDSERAHIMRGQEPRATQDHHPPQETNTQPQNTVSAARRSEATAHPHITFTMVHRPTEQHMHYPIPVATVMQPSVFDPIPCIFLPTYSFRSTSVNPPSFQEVDSNDDSWVEGMENAEGAWGTSMRVNPSPNVGMGISEDEDDHNLWMERTGNTERDRGTSSDPRTEIWTRQFEESVQERNRASEPVEANWSSEERHWSSSSEKETAGSLGMCVVCVQRPRSTMFLDCGHIACCQQCSNSLSACPACRAVIRKVQKAYLP